jgi:hypothetical protein
MQRTEDHPAAESSDVRPGNVHRLIPDLAYASGAYYAQLAALADPALVELCRLRITQIVGNAEQMNGAVRIDAGQLAELAAWRDSDRFDAVQKACLEYAEYFCYSSESVKDEHVARLTPYLSAEQILSLTCALWISDAFHRMSNFLKLIRTKETADAPHSDH